MAVWNDLERGHEAEFDAWYRRQHVPERLQQPGFVEARRYVSEAGSPRYCAIYWLESIAALATPQYLARLAQPTMWTRRNMPWFRNMARTPLTVRLIEGRGTGGMMIWVAAFGAPTATNASITRLASVLTSLCDQPSIVRIQFWECDPALRALANPEQRLRTARDQVADWIVFIEGAETAALAGAAGEVRATIEPDANGAALRISPSYRLLWALNAHEAPSPCTDEAAGVSPSA